MKYQISCLWLASFIVPAILSGCSAEFGLQGDASRLSQLAPNGVVCEPFSNETPTDPRYGIHGRVHYLDDSQPRYALVNDYWVNGADAGVELFLNRLYVPTRNFSTGFNTSSGLLLKRLDGQVLQEYFSLHLEAGLVPDATFPAGSYQLAILSDDGAVLKVTESGSTRTLIDNDGSHSTKMGCATSPITLTAGASVPMRLDYYQGPRTEIALVMLWRPYPAPAQVNDPLCGSVGQTLFFDPRTNPSTPQQAYLDLLSRGWQPLKASNFMLLSGTNKCVH